MWDFIKKLAGITPAQSAVVEAKAVEAQAAVGAAYAKLEAIAKQVSETVANDVAPAAKKLADNVAKDVTAAATHIANEVTETVEEVKAAATKRSAKAVNTVSESAPGQSKKPRAPRKPKSETPSE